MKKSRTILAFVSATLFVVMLFTCCSGSNSYEKQLATSWYAEGEDSPAFTLYSDGTCEIDGEYGTGKWSVVNEDQLKLTNFYGESIVVTIVSIEDGCLTISDGGENTAYMWNSPQKQHLDI